MTSERPGEFGKLLNKNFVWDKVVISEKQKKKKKPKKIGVKTEKIEILNIMHGERGKNIAKI